MDFIFGSDSISISDDEMCDIDCLIGSGLFPNSVWKSIDPYADGCISGKGLEVLIAELSEYELFLEDPYVQKVKQLHTMAERAFITGGSIRLIGD